MLIRFCTPTALSPLDIITLGDSVKRDNESLIGRFGSGFKYALALLLRNEVNVYIDVEDETFTIPSLSYSFDTVKLEDVNTQKEKTVIRLIEVNHKTSETNYHVTGFSIELGYNWELWMAFREIYSNMIDEGGYWEILVDSHTPLRTDVVTTITLEFSDSNDFAGIIDNIDNYICISDPLYKLNSIYNSTSTLELHSNPEGHLKIYKQKVLVYENRDKKSLYSYNIPFGEIDERRLLNDVSVVRNAICSRIYDTNNEEFLRTIINKDVIISQDDWLQGASPNYGAKASNLISRIYNEIGYKVKTFDWITDGVLAREDCTLNGRKISTIEDAWWESRREVTIEDVQEPTPEVKLTFEQLIAKHYAFDLGKITLKIATLKGSRVVADKHNKVLLISDEFSVENDMIDFTIQYTELVRPGNVIHELAKTILDQLKK